MCPGPQPRSQIKAVIPGLLREPSEQIALARPVIQFVGDVPGVLLGQRVVTGLRLHGAIKPQAG